MIIRLKILEEYSNLKVLDLVKINDIKPSKNSAYFNWQKPHECFDNFTISCVDSKDNSKFSNAKLLTNGHSKQGSCLNLISGHEYILKSATSLDVYSRSENLQKFYTSIIRFIILKKILIFNYILINLF